MTASRGLRTHTAAAALYGGITSVIGCTVASVVCAATGRHVGVFIGVAVAFVVVAVLASEWPVAWLECRLAGRAPYCDHCGQPVSGAYSRSLDGPERWHPRCQSAAAKLAVVELLESLGGEDL